MTDTINRPDRKVIRLQNWDYAASGVYFVTICTVAREHLFGRIREGEVYLSNAGQIAHDAWLETEQVRPSVVFDAFVIMPNHMHALVMLSADDVPNAPAQLRGLGALAPRSLSSLINGYKGAVTRRCRKIGIQSIWQSRYYDQIVRNERALQNIRAYIASNPNRWHA